MNSAATPALKALKKAAIPCELLAYKYQERGGTRAAAQALGIDEHLVIKTLIFETEGGQPVVALMPGDRQVSLKKLALASGAANVRPAEPRQAEKYSGYRVGGISPFGLKKAMPVYVEQEIYGLEKIYLNAGCRGRLVSLSRASGWLETLKGQPANLKQ